MSLLRKALYRTELAAEADRLLREIPRDENAPHYTELSFESKMYRQDIAATKRPWASRGLDYLSAETLSVKTVGLVIAQAGLNTAQAEVLSLRLSGFTLREIGIIRGHSKQWSHMLMRQTQKLIVSAMASEPSVGTADAYREMVGLRNPSSRFME